MRILFALSGLHRVHRGAEIAFTALARQLARLGEDVTLIGSGPAIEGAPYRYIKVGAIPRERFENWPKIPVFRNEEIWEESTFALGLLRSFRPADYDVTVTCGFPFCNWVLRRPTLAGRRPPHVYVTQNGEWPIVSNRSEYRTFDCDGVVCINPDYLRNAESRYKAALIPNGVDTDCFAPGRPARERFGLPTECPIVLMVSALTPIKNVEAGVQAVALLPDAHLVVAGDGPLRSQIERLAQSLMPGRYHRLTLAPGDMPALYRSVDAFLHVSRDEAFGNVFVEAMASGLPIVAYDLPRTRWILGEEGCLASQSSEALAAQLLSALGKEGERRSRLRARAKAFDWGVIAQRYRDFLRDIVNRRMATSAGTGQKASAAIREGQSSWA